MHEERDSCIRVTFGFYLGGYLVRISRKTERSVQFFLLFLYFFFLWPKKDKFKKMLILGLVLSQSSHSVWAWVTPVTCSVILQCWKLMSAAKWGRAGRLDGDVYVCTRALENKLRTRGNWCCTSKRPTTLRNDPCRKHVGLPWVTGGDLFFFL